MTFTDSSTLLSDFFLATIPEPSVGKVFFPGEGGDKVETSSVIYKL